MSSQYKPGTGSRTEPPDWVAVERVKRGQPVGRPLFQSEKVVLVRWARQRGVTYAELADRIILPDGRKTAETTVQKWVERYRDMINA